MCLRFFVQSRGHGTDFLACQSTRVTTDFPELIQTLRHHLTDLLAHIECNGILFLINTIIIFDETLKLTLLQIYFLNSFSIAISWHTALANSAKFYVNSANYGHLCCSNRARNSSRKMTIHLNKGRSATDFDILPDRRQLGNWLL